MIRIVQTGDTAIEKFNARPAFPEEAEAALHEAREALNAAYTAYRNVKEEEAAAKKNLDELNGNSDNSDHYTASDKQRFEQYLSGQLAKIQLPDKDESFLRERILTMYANPVRNKLAAQ